MKLIPRDDFFLDDVFSDFLSSKDTNSFKCDIYEKEGKYFIELDTPGCSKEDTSIECDNGYLTVIFLTLNFNSFKIFSSL